MKEIPILFSEWRYWVIEEETTEYPWTLENPAYFCSPIYLNDENKLEMRRAGADWIFSFNSVLWHNFSEKEINEIKESILKFLKFCEKHMDYFKESSEYKTFGYLIEE